MKEELRVIDGDMIKYTDRGKLHRENGPAVISESGTKYWFRHGRLHRTDGAAIEWNDGDKWFYLNGFKVPREQVMGEADNVKNRVKDFLTSM